MKPMKTTKLKLEQKRNGNRKGNQNRKPIRK
jgi:hypothetical protein